MKKIPPRLLRATAEQGSETLEQGLVYHSGALDCVYVLVRRLRPVSGFMVFPSNPQSGGHQNAVVQ